MFLGEFLYRMVTEPQDDARMYEFVENSVMALETMEKGTANFHLWFLVRFAAMMGRIRGRSVAGHQERHIYVPPHPQRMAPQYCGMMERVRRCSLEGLSELEMSREMRSQLLEALTEYYRFHSSSFKEMNSLSFFKDIF